MNVLVILISHIHKIITIIELNGTVHTSHNIFVVCAKAPLMQSSSQPKTNQTHNACFFGLLPLVGDEFHSH